MNSYLDKGIFLAIWGGFLYGADYLTVQHGYVTFTSIFVGAAAMAIIGLLIEAYGKKNEKA